MASWPLTQLLFFLLCLFLMTYLLTYESCGRGERERENALDYTRKCTPLSLAYLLLKHPLLTYFCGIYAWKTLKESCVFYYVQADRLVGL